MNRPRIVPPHPIAQYTVHVKYSYRWSFVLVILVAVITALVVVHQQRQSLHIEQLLESPAVTDKLEAIYLLQHASFDTLQSHLVSIIGERNDASKAAQQLLVKRAFFENRLDDLKSLPIDEDLSESVLWWASTDNREKRNPQDEQQYQRVVTSDKASSWIRRLAALRCRDVTPTSLDALINMPPRDRDGSVMLTVLAIERHASPETVFSLIQTWAAGYDVDQQKAATLLAALIGQPIPMIPTQDNALSTLTSICVVRHTALAWRAMHEPDGVINPDIALAALIIDRELFLPILIDSARSNRWFHPEHPVELSRRFAPSVTELIPPSMLDQDSRDKWWSLFACGLLKEDR